MTWWLALACVSVLAQDMSFLWSGRKTSIALEHSNTDGGTHLTENRLQFAVPVFKSEKSVWNVSLKGQHVHLGETLQIADRALDIPKDFGSGEVGFGANFPSEKVNRGFNASIGTTGRQLFNSENSRVVSLTYFSEWKTLTKNSWYFFLSYSNNRTTLNNIPLPGFAYGVKGENYNWLVGFPFVFFNWRPMPWIWTIFSSPFTSFTDVAYVVSGPWQVMTGLAWQPRSYQNIAPDVDDERLLFEKKEWTIGGRMAFGPFHSASLAYVYQFDRRFFVGESITERNSTATNLPDAGGVQLKLQTSF